MSTWNPLRYKPAQIAKALVAVLTGIIGLLGLAASTFSDGALATVGTWATASALFLTPILVFLKKVEPWIGVIEGGLPGGGPEG
ncbi:hypothetical protein ACW9HF_15200 [Nocardia gipuzkoensis]